MERRIIHLDMDAFYASIEERDNPELRGKPVIVGAPPGTRGVVSTCNYIARWYGVRSAMSSAEAYRRCPHAIFVNSHFKKYTEASKQVHEIMSEYTDKIEFVSLDEGYMDVGGSELLFGDAASIAKAIQKRVFETVGTTCSVGVGYSMMSAKCASEEKKPRGFFAIYTPEEFMALMHERPVGELYGVGKRTAERLVMMGIKTIGQLAKASDERLKIFGSVGIAMKRHALGIDNREVVANAPPKSVGRETTFLKDTNDRDFLNDTLALLASDVGFRLYQNGMWCKTVTLKIKYADMKSVTRAHTGKFMRDSNQLYKAAAKILDELELEKAVRLIGISTSNLTTAPWEQLSFEEAADSDKADTLSDTVFKIRQEFGKGILKTGKEIAAEKSAIEHMNDIKYHPEDKR